MAQVNSLSLANGSGLEVRTELNLALAALFSGNAGTSAPPVTVPGMTWVDTTGGNAVLKIRNAADNGWISFLDGAAVTALLATAGAPAGTVVWYAANSAPAGFLKANGALVSRTTYAALFAAIGTTFGAGDGSTTFALPDLRGEFVRGWDDGRGIDSGRTFGSAQDDAMQGHHHGFRLAQGLTGGPAGTNEGIWNSNVGSAGNAVLGAITDGANGTPRTAAETRSRNVALLACIKF